MNAELQQVRGELAAARESEARYRAVFERGLAGIFLARPDGRVLAANPEACRMLGRTEAEICAVGRGGVMSPSDPHLQQALAERFRTGYFRGELTMLHADGSQLPVEVASTEYRDQNGELLSLVIFQDLSAHKRTEAALAESESFLKNIYQHVGAAVFIVKISPAGEFHYAGWNPVAEMIVGIPPAQGLGRTPEEVFGPVVGPRLRQRYVRCVNEGLLTFEECFTHDHGTVWGRATLTLMRDATGRPVQIVGFAINITETKRTEAALREQQNLLHFIVEGTSDAVYVKDTQGRYLLFNSAACRFTGKLAPEVLGRDDLALFPLEEARQVMEYDRRIMASGVTETQERSLTTGAGPKTFLATKGPLRDAQGQIIGLFGVSRDITERKQAEELLHEQRALLANVIEGTHAGTWRWNIATGQCEINERWAEMLGYTVAELAPITIQTWLPLVHPEDLKHSDTARDAHFNRTTEIYECEFRMRHKDGSWIWMEDRGKVVQWSPDGKPLVMAGTHVDITARKHAEAESRDGEARLKFLMRNTPAVIYSLNAAEDLVTTFISQNVEKVLGHPAEAFLKAPDFWCAHVHPDDIAMAQADLQHLYATGALTRDYRFRHADGRYRWMHDDMHLIRDAQGQGQTVVGYWLDVTEEREATKALQAERDRLRQILDSQFGFVAVLSLEGGIEEINQTPLTLMNWSRAEALGRNFCGLGCFDPETAAQVQVMLVAAGRGETTRAEIPADFPTLGRRVVEAVFGPLRDPNGVVTNIIGFGVDITERKQAETAMQLDAAMMRNMAEGVQLTRASDGVIVQVNAQFEQMFGYEPGEMVGRHVSILNAPTDEDPLETAREIVAAVRKEGKWQGEILNLKKDGTQFWCFASVSIFAHPTMGELWVSVHQDITERKRAETALLMAEERARQKATLLRAIMESPKGVIIFSLDRSYCYTEFTRPHRETMKQIWGVEIAVGMNMLEVISDPADRAKAKRNFDSALRGESVVLLEEYGDQSHYRTYFEDHYNPIFESDGTISGLTVFVIDVTERRRMEEANVRLARAVEQAGESIMVTDFGRDILYVNPAFEKTSGYTRAEVVGQNARILKSGKQDAQFYRQMWTVLGRGETWHGHFINRHKDGTFFEEDATISAIRNAAGKIVSYVAVKHDVTREKQLETQIRQAQKMQAIGQLAGGIAHDFNNILAAIVGNVHFAIADMDPGHPAHESLEEIQKASNRAKDLVQQLLAYSRQETRERRLTALEPVMAEAVKFLRAAIRAGVEISLVVADDVPSVLADATQIHQVVSNLGINAWHALEGQPGRIAIQLQAVTLDDAASQSLRLRPGRFACLTVSDNGKGMSAAVRERIFDPFFTTKPPGKGTGLGLSVVQGIVESHEGAITVSSEPGQGATFQVYLPAAAASAKSETVSVTPPAPTNLNHE